MKVVVLYGTETGNAEMCAESVAGHLREQAEVEIHDMADVDVDVLNQPGFYVFVTSTFGEGELPAGTDSFFTSLDDTSPDLSHVRAAVFGLGDSYYDDTFNKGCQIVAERLIALGATLEGEIGCYDTSTGEPPEDEALAWAQSLPVLQAI